MSSNPGQTTTPSGGSPEKEWVSPNEGVMHAPDPNAPKFDETGGFKFGGALYPSTDWLTGALGTSVSHYKKIKAT